MLLTSMTELGAFEERPAGVVCLLIPTEEGGAPAHLVHRAEWDRGDTLLGVVSLLRAAVITGTSVYT